MIRALFYAKETDTIINLNKKENETSFEWKLRCCKAKLNHQTNLDWQEIADLLGLEVSADHLRKTAYGLIEYDNYIHNDGVSTRILSVSDFHVPFNLEITPLQSYADRVDILIFNGDIEDCFSCSSYTRKYRIGLDSEMVETRKLMMQVIDMIHPKQVFVNMGNHEYRLSRHLCERLNEDIISIMPDSPLELIVNHGFRVKDRINKTETWYDPLSEVYRYKGIEVLYDGSWYCKVGKTIFAHPLSYTSGMLKTTEKAVEYFLRTDRDFDTVVLGHTHRIGSYVQGNIHMYEQGCMCDLSKLDYANGKLIIPSQNGFIYVCQDENGKIMENRTQLVSLAS